MSDKDEEKENDPEPLQVQPVKVDSVLGTNGTRPKS